MAEEVISHINDKYEAAYETQYGVAPGSITALNWGQMQTLSWRNERNVSKGGGINGGAFADTLEDGVTYVSGSGSTRITKGSIPLLLEAALGVKTDNGEDYEIDVKPDGKSYTVNIQHKADKYRQFVGFVMTSLTLNINKGDFSTIDFDYIAKKGEEKSGVLTPTANDEKQFFFTDCEITIGGNPYILNSFSWDCSWNVDDTEGRGTEAAPTGERLLIRRVTKHAFDMSGSAELESYENLDLSFQDERTDEEIVVTLKRGTDNVHNITIPKTRTSNEEQESSTDNSLRTISVDFEMAGKPTITGDN